MACVISAEAAKEALVVLRVQQLRLAIDHRMDDCDRVARAADHIEAALAVHVAGEAVAR